ncbi:MAG: transcription antitermination protein NusB [Alphaproteobacteria bacterium]
MASPAEKKQKPSQSAQNRSARLLAVQTLYAVYHSGEPVREVAAEILARSESYELEGEKIIPPNKVLYQKIVTGVFERGADIEGIMTANIKNPKENDSEVLLKSILMCGIYELLAHHDIDVGIIINDYLDVAHGFYDSAQVKLVNGVLDSVAKILRA